MFYICVFVLISAGFSDSASISSSSPSYKFSWDDWSQCPQGMYISSLGVISDNRTYPNPLIGLTINCTSLNPDKSDAIVTIVIRKEDVEDFQTKNTSCKNSGILTGLQYKVLYKEDEKGFSKTILELRIFCDDTKEIGRGRVSVGKNHVVKNGTYKDPMLCGWGEYACALKVQYLTKEDEASISNIKIGCCPAFDSGIGWRSYRESRGRILQSPNPMEHSLNSSFKSESLLPDHLDHKLDIPYYYKWQFCPTSYFVTGMKLQRVGRRMQFLCADLSRPSPRMTESIQMPTTLNSIWEEDEQLSDEAECEGVVIGIQYKFHHQHGIQEVRLFCSFSEIENQLSYVQGRFSFAKNEIEGEWSPAQMCGRNEAVCGFKEFTTQSMYGTGHRVFAHSKVKCCSVPKIAEICFPNDKYELIVECDATNAWADSTCQYTQTEGITVSDTMTMGQRREEQLRSSLSQEWTISESETEREAKSIGQSASSTNSESHGSVIGATHSAGSSGSTGTTNSNSSQVGFTNSNSTGGSSGSSTSAGESSSNENSLNRGESGGFSSTKGQNVGSAKSQTKGKSESSTSGTSSSISNSRSTQETNGISKGTMNAVARGKSQSQQSSSSDTSSQSSSYSDSSSQSSSYSKTRGQSQTSSQGSEVSASAGFSMFGFSASVSTSLRSNFEQSSSSSVTASNEQTNSQSKTSSNEQSRTNTRGSSSEASQQNTHQENTEIQKSVGNTNSNEISKGSSNSRGKEASEQNSISSNVENSASNSIDKRTESSNSNTSRVSIESGHQLNNQSNFEQSASVNRNVGSEQSTNTQITENEEIGRSISQNVNTENSAMLSSNKNIERSKDASINRGESGGKNDETGFTTGYDWGKSSSRTWNVEKSYQITMSVPAGMRAQLFQVVGYCAFYQIRTSKFKRVDYVAEWALGEYLPKESNVTVQILQ